MAGRGDDDGDERGGAVTSRRVVHGRRGASPVLALLVVAVVGAAGFVLTSGGSGSSSSDEHDDRVEASEAFAVAALRLDRAYTFAYRGTVRSDGTNAVRPGPWTAETVTVEGAVDLVRGLTTEVAVGPGGAAVETVTSGDAVWARSARSHDELADAPWESLGIVDVGGRVESVPGVSGSRLSVALLATVLPAAGDRRDAPPDDAGRRVIRAMVPDRVGMGVGVGWRALDGLLTGADIAVTLDDAGDIAHVEVASAPGSPLLDLDLDLDLVRLGEQVVTAQEYAEAIRQTMPADVLAAVGVGSLDLPGLPSTWALTSASVDQAVDPRRGLPPACTGASVSVGYVDLAALSEGWMSVWVGSEACADALSGTGGVGTGPSNRAPFTAGRFIGEVYDAPSGPVSGSLSDGSTSIWFSTDLSPERAAAALASLAPAA